MFGLCVTGMTAARGTLPGPARKAEPVPQQSTTSEAPARPEPGDQQAGDHQAGDQQAGDHQAGDQQAGDQHGLGNWPQLSDRELVRLVQSLPPGQPGAQ